MTNEIEHSGVVALGDGRLQACPGADDPEERCPRHPSECTCWQIDTDHPMMKRAAPQSVINPTHSQVAGTPGLLTDPAPANHVTTSDADRQWLWRVPGRGWVMADNEDDVCHSVKVAGEWVSTDVIEITHLTPAPSNHVEWHSDPYLRIVNLFDMDATAGEFLAEDGEGGHMGAVYRMAREIDRLRSDEKSPAQNVEDKEIAGLKSQLKATEAALEIMIKRSRDVTAELVAERRSSAPAPNSVLRAALKSFATDADIYDDQGIDDGEKSFKDNITVGDLRRARAALAASEGPADA